MSRIAKVDIPSENDHYRPVAILPVLSKIYERLILIQLLEYVNAEQILNNNISRFRKGHSTTTVLLRIRDDIIHAMKKKEITLIAFADFSRAFDTVGYSMMLKKTPCYWFLTRYTYLGCQLSKQQRAIRPSK